MGSDIDNAIHARMVIKNSPVPFVVTGPSLSHRSVLVRSENATLDLVGADSGYEDWLGGTSSGLSLLGIFSSNLDSDIDTYSVRSKATYNSGDSNEARGAHLTFSWKGLANASDLKFIEKVFNTISTDLYMALQHRSYENVEWQLATIVEICHRTTRLKRRSLKTRKNIYLFAIFVYVALAFVAVYPFMQKIILRY
jgi:hypothetical protein